MTLGTILTLGGGGFSTEPDNPLLDDFLLSLVPAQRRGGGRPRVCFVPTASGDDESYIEGFEQAFAGRAETTVLRLFHRAYDDLAALVHRQDVVYVGGGSTANLLAVWRVHGLDRALVDAAAHGVVLAGISAGMNCWFEGSVTDSFGEDRLDALPDGLGMIPGSACPHYDGELLRRPCYREMVGTGQLPDGHAAYDGCALLFRNGTLAEAVSSRPDARAFRVSRRGSEVVEDPLPVRFLGAVAEPETGMPDRC